MWCACLLVLVCDYGVVLCLWLFWLVGVLRGVVVSCVTWCRAASGLRVGGVVFWLGGWWLNCALSVLGFGFIVWGAGLAVVVWVFGIALWVCLW